MNDKKVMFKVTRPDTHGSDFCVYTHFSSVECEIDGAEVGDKICIEIVEMTEQEFRDLGDFEGW